MDEPNLDQVPQDINKEEFQLERVHLQAFVAITDPGCKKEFLRQRKPTLRHRFKDYISEIKRLPTAPTPASQQKRRKMRRSFASPQKDAVGKKARLERGSHPPPLPLPWKAHSLPWRKEKLFRRELGEIEKRKDVAPGC
ncbi:hypothetical protein TNCV_4411181 [Trichonephila clavipes]|nr:hypothetical protein TNCV_4411181 [Trichonephila clavipes]